LNGIEAAPLDGYDPNFVRELLEAERLLHVKEKLLKAVEKVTSPWSPWGGNRSSILLLRF
jgi:hypothetical protein